MPPERTSLSPKSYIGPYERMIVHEWAQMDGKSAASNLRLFQDRYEHVAERLPASIPWYWIAAIHRMECSASFSCQVLNGEKWNRKTKLYPKGLGPWDSWEDSAIQGIAYQLTRYYGNDSWQRWDWTIGRCLEQAERWNGMGYWLRGLWSPYVFGGTDICGLGKFTSDNKWDAEAETKQIGVAVIMKAILEEWDR